MYIGFDNDKEGTRFTQTLVKYIDENMIPPQKIICAQAIGKDFNEDLLMKKGYILNDEKNAIAIQSDKKTIKT